MAFASPETRSCKFSTKIMNRLTWELDCPGWVLAVWGSEMWGDVVSVCPGVVWAAKPWPEWVTCWIDSFLGVVDKFCFLHSAEEWLLLFWREAMDIGRWRTMIFPSFGRRTPSCFMIFMKRLLKERHIHAVVFPIVWKIWAQMLIGAPLMRSYKNCALPRLMNPMLKSGYRLENIMNVRVFSSGLNFVVPKDVPLAETLCSAPRIWRISNTWGSLPSYGELSTFVGRVMRRIFVR